MSDAPAEDQQRARILTEVNGAPVDVVVPHGLLLLDLLRNQLRLTGPKRSCDVQLCGACTVLVDDLPVSSCCLLAGDVQHRRVRTIEGLVAESDPLYRRLEDAFVAHAAVQCGFCTPGFITTLHYLISHGELDADSTDTQIRDLLRGNLCRCTGYEPILHSVRAVLSR